MPTTALKSACWLLPDLGHYHHPRIQAAAAGPATAYVLEVHDRPGFAEFRYVPGPDARYHVERVSGSIAASLDRLRPSVVFLNGWVGRDAIDGLRWCGRSGTPAVVMSESTRHDASPDDRRPDPGRPVRRRWWREAVKRRVVRQFSAALVGGTPHRRYVVELGLPAEQVFDGYDVVDNDYYAAGADAARAHAVSVRVRLRLPERFFLASARFIPKKNLPRLVQAFAAYRSAAGPDAWDLVLLGDGPVKPDVVRLIADLGVGGSVHLPGFRPLADLPSYYGAAGALVHASTTEQWGLVVNEAMAAGLPVVVSRTCGCAPDLVADGVTGFTFDPYDLTALTRALLTVNAPSFDRGAMGRAARARVAEWSPARFATNFWRAAEAALRAGPPRQRLVHRLLLSFLGN
jgi:glycosyltransferase involved in cell wall biosynthesis